MTDDTTKPTGVIPVQNLQLLLIGSQRSDRWNTTLATNALVSQSPTTSEASLEPISPDNLERSSNQQDESIHPLIAMKVIEKGCIFLLAYLRQSWYMAAAILPIRDAASTSSLRLAEVTNEPDKRSMNRRVKFCRPHSDAVLNC